MSHGKQVLIAFDQLVNALFGGWADETLSSRAWRWYVSGKRLWPCVWLDRLFFWDSHHCRKSYEYEVQRRHLPESMR